MPEALANVKFKLKYALGWLHLQFHGWFLCDWLIKLNWELKTRIPWGARKKHSKQGCLGITEKKKPQYLHRNGYPLSS